MEKPMTKEEFNELMALEGTMSGLSLKGYGEFILREEGEDGLEKLEKTIADLGYDIDYQKIASLDEHPIGLESVTLELVKRLFDYDDKKIEQMGRAEFRSSTVTRLFMKYFVSLETAAKHAQRMLREHFSIGKVEVAEINKEEHYLVIQVRDFDLRPSSCKSMGGVLASAVGNIVGKHVSVKEPKCTFEGDGYHEFVLSW